MDRKNLWRSRLAQSRADLDAFLDSLTPEQWQTPVFSEGQSWTIKDVVSHLVDSENGMSIHIYKTRKGRETVPANFDLNKWNAGVRERVGEATPAELRERLRQNRARLLEGLDTLTDDEWQLTGRHPFRGVITIEQYFETIADHEATHTQDMRQALAAA